MRLASSFFPALVLSACNIYGTDPAAGVQPEPGYISGKHVYLECSMGPGTFAMNSLNKYFIGEYSSVFNKGITGGTSFEAEIGMYAEDFLKIGISYIKASGIIEINDTKTFTDRDSNSVLWDSWYIDTYFRGAEICIRYYPPLHNRRIKIFAGGKNMLGSGVAHLGMGTRPSISLDDYGYDNFSALGAGISILTGAEFFPVPQISAGISCGYRIIRTGVLRNKTDGAPWRRPPSDPHDITLDFSGFFAQGKISLEL
jgi:hypothetical protein